MILFCSNANSEKTINVKLGPYNIVFIDADHKYQNVKNDFNNYCNFISDKGLIIMHDIFLPNSGSKKFWNQIKTKRDKILNLKKLFVKDIHLNME